MVKIPKFCRLFCDSQDRNTVFNNFNREKDVSPVQLVHLRVRYKRNNITFQHLENSQSHLNQLSSYTC